jgi:hypothetical protein
LLSGAKGSGATYIIKKITSLKGSLPKPKKVGLENMSQKNETVQKR